MTLKNIVAGAILAAAAQLCAVDATSMLVTFAPPEDPEAVDTYSDGSMVLDGERYALVWHPKTESAFGGITAAGTAARDGDKILKIAPLAKNGRIPAPCVVFPISRSCYDGENLASGTFALYLLDTRVSNGDGTYSLAASGLDVNAAGCIAAKADAGEAGSGGAAVKTATPSKATVTAVAPGNVPQPEIVDFELDGATAYITMKKNANVVRVGGADNLSGSFVTSPHDAETDNGDGTVTIAVPAGGDSGFFNVKGIR